MAAKASTTPDEFTDIVQHLDEVPAPQPLAVMTGSLIVSERALPWTGISAITNEHQGVTSQELLKAGDLDWGVKVRPFLRFMDDGTTPQSARAREVVKDTPEQDFLGIVRTKYTPLANREIFAFGDEIVKTGEGIWVAAGQQNGGGRVLMVMRLIKEFSVLGTDTHQLFVVFRSAHDGSCSIRADVIPLRKACLNQNHVSISGTQSSWKIIHTTNLAQRAEEARNSMKMALAYQKAYAQLAKELAHITIDGEKGTKIIEKIIRKNRARRDEVVADIEIHWHSSSTIPDELRFTGYGLLNAVTEYYGHFARRTNVNSAYESIMNGEAAQVRDALMRQLIG